MTAAMAWVRPVWRQTHELDTGESAGFSEGRNAVQRRRLAVTNVQPEDLAAAVGVAPVAMTTAGETTRPSTGP